MQTLRLCINLASTKICSNQADFLYMLQRCSCICGFESQDSVLECVVVLACKGVHIFISKQVCNMVWACLSCHDQLTLLMCRMNGASRYLCHGRLTFLMCSSDEWKVHWPPLGNCFSCFMTSTLAPLNLTAFALLESLKSNEQCCIVNYLVYSS
jgi:hypothetical protein